MRHPGRTASPTLGSDGENPASAGAGSDPRPPTATAAVGALGDSVRKQLFKHLKKHHNQPPPHDADERPDSDTAGADARGEDGNPLGLRRSTPFAQSAALAALAAAFPPSPARTVLQGSTSTKGRSTAGRVPKRNRQAQQQQQQPDVSGDSPVPAIRRRRSKKQQAIEEAAEAAALQQRMRQSATPPLPQEARGAAVLAHEGGAALPVAGDSTDAGTCALPNIRQLSADAPFSAAAASSLSQPLQCAATALEPFEGMLPVGMDLAAGWSLFPAGSGGMVNLAAHAAALHGGFPPTMTAAEAAGAAATAEAVAAAAAAEAAAIGGAACGARADRERPAAVRLGLSKDDAMTGLGAQQPADMHPPARRLSFAAATATAAPPIRSLAGGGLGLIPSFATVEQRLGGGGPSSSSAAMGSGPNPCWTQPQQPGAGALPLMHAHAHAHGGRPPLAHPRQQLLGGRALLTAPTFDPAGGLTTGPQQQSAPPAAAPAVQPPPRRLSQRSVLFLDGLVGRPIASLSTAADGRPARPRRAPSGCSFASDAAAAHDCCAPAGVGGVSAATDARVLTDERLSVQNLLEWPVASAKQQLGGKLPPTDGAAAAGHAGLGLVGRAASLPPAAPLRCGPRGFGLPQLPAGCGTLARADLSGSLEGSVGGGGPGLLGVAPTPLRRCSSSSAQPRPTKSDRQSGWEAITRVSQLLQQQTPPPPLPQPAQPNPQQSAQPAEPAPDDPLTQPSTAAAPTSSTAPAAASVMLPAAGAAAAGGGGGDGPSISVLQRGLRYDGDLTLEDLIRAFELRNAYDWDEDLSVSREAQVRSVSGGGWSCCARAMQ